MGLELRRDSKQQLRSKWWYGRYIINGERKFVNLGVEIKGRVPENLRKQGDMAFECSRTLAAAKLKDLLAEAHSRKTAAHHLQELYEIKSGEEIAQIPLTDMEEPWELLPAKRKRAKQKLKHSQRNGECREIDFLVRQFRDANGVE